MLESGRSALITGAAGAGKTYLLNKFIRRAKKRGQHVAITATTGLAATHLNGATIHAWSGIGVRDALDEHAITNLGKQRQDLIQKADILVIDEISMLHDFRLDMIDNVLRLVRDTDAPFGGVQVVLCGDFFQLPPVNRHDSRQGSFVTNSIVWRNNVFTICYLKTQFRQADDEQFTDILNGIRAGVLTRNQLKTLQDRGLQTPEQTGSKTRLLTVNVDVDVVNHKHLQSLKAESREYEMSTHGSAKYVEQLQRSCLAPELLQLKIGAQVMCIKNAPDRKYANGSLGVVVGFEQGTDYPIVRLLNGREVYIKPESWDLMDGDKRRASIVQLPLRLAWAITVHKSQGMTLDAAQIDLRRAFVEGMGYVALSRVRSLEHLTLDGLNGMALKVSPLARAIDAELQQKSTDAVRELNDIINTWQKDEANGVNEQKAVQDAAAVNPPADPELFDRLRAWRAAAAKTQNVPPYIVAHDKALSALAAYKPTTEQALLNVPGFGPKKAELYGRDIFNIVNDIKGALPMEDQKYELQN